MSDALSSHGTLIAREISAGNFVTIGELGDITPPGLTRPSTEVTPQNDKIDAYVVGVLKRGEMTFPINFVPTDGTHDEATGLIKAMDSKALDGYRITWVDSTTWIFSGYVTNFQPAAPAREGGLTADVTIRPSGGHIIEGTPIGVT
jgi:hypothetical protein